MDDPHPWIFTLSMDEHMGSSVHFTRLVAGGSTNLKKIHGYLIKSMDGDPDLVDKKNKIFFNSSLMSTQAGKSALVDKFKKIKY